MKLLNTNETKIHTGGKPQRFDRRDSWRWFDDYLDALEVTDSSKSEWSFIEEMELDLVRYLRTRVTAWKKANSGYNILTRSENDGLKGRYTFFFIKVKA